MPATVVIPPATSDPKALELAASVKAQGNAAFSGGAHEHAVALYTHALELAPRSALLWCNRATAYGALGRWELAAADARKSLWLDDTWLKAYARCAKAFYELGRPVVQTYALVLKGRALDQYNEELRELAHRLHDAWCLERDRDPVIQAMIARGMPSQAVVSRVRAGGGQVADAGGAPDLSPADLQFLLTTACDAALWDSGSDRDTQEVRAALGLLWSAEAPGVGSYLAELWPHTAEAVPGLQYSEEEGSFAALVVRDGARAFDALLDHVAGAGPPAPQARSPALVRACGDAGAGHETAAGVAAALPALSPHPAHCSQLAPPRSPAELTPEQIDAFVRECCRQLDGKTSWYASESGEGKPLRCTKEGLQTFHAVLLGALLDLRAVQALPSMRRALMLDSVDLETCGDWDRILRRLHMQPESEVDVRLDRRSAMLREARAQYRLLRSLAAQADAKSPPTSAWAPPPSREELARYRYTPGPAGGEGRTGLDWRDPKCVNLYCDRFHGGREGGGSIGAGAGEPFRAAHACEQCRAPYCSPECRQEDRGPHQQVCHLGKYSTLGLRLEAGKAAEDEDTALHHCAACFASELYPRHHKMCDRCRAVWYCSDVCQAHHSDYGGHRETCTPGAALEEDPRAWFAKFELR